MNVPTRAVFLDRDGVLNHAIVRAGRPYPPAGLSEIELLPGVRKACAALRAAGYLLIVVTNQPDIARGKQTREAVDAMNGWMQRELALDQVQVCPHDDRDACACRKPAPGMLLEAARQRNIDLGASFMIGDRWRDVEAGRRAGCRTVYLNCKYGERQASGYDHEAPDLPAAAQWILKRGGIMNAQQGWKTKLFADTADLASMLRLAADPNIRGFTTNPTLMRRAGVSDYEGFAREAVAHIPDRPVSFEVLSDEFEEMERQAIRIGGWGSCVYVKVPITNTRGASSLPVLRSLAARGVKMNVTAMMTLRQLEAAAEAVKEAPGAFLSIFAGRIADTGRDPIPVMVAALDILRAYPKIELIWASPREILNIAQANAIGCHIITVTPDLLGKLPLLGKDLDEFSLETVRMFETDARQAGFRLEV
jgi:transaldolase